jgi:hypothetical protein
MTEMGIPRLGESWAILDQERSQTVDFVRAKAMRLRKTDRLKPKLSDVLAVFNIDVRRFGSLKAIKEEPEVGDSQHGRHAVASKHTLSVRCVSTSVPPLKSSWKARRSPDAPHHRSEITAALSAVNILKEFPIA